MEGLIVACVSLIIVSTWLLIAIVRLQQRVSVLEQWRHRAIEEDRANPYKAARERRESGT